jgi:uncharacterized protein YbaP (TraB family)
MSAVVRRRVWRLLAGGLACWLAQSLFAPAQAGDVCGAAPELPAAARVKALQAHAVDRGFLWRLEKDGHRSWLYGTLHVARESWMVPGPIVRRALAASDSMALELDVNDAATQAELARLAREGAGQVPAALRPRMARQLARVCLSEAAIDKLHPAVLFAAIQLISLRGQGLESVYGIDAYLSRYAHARGIPLTALETPASQMAALRGGDGEVVPAADVEEALQDLETGRERKPIEQLVQAWSMGDAARLDAYLANCACRDTPLQRAQMKALLDDRNPVLARAIDALHRRGGSVFAAVGTLHMVGENGLPALLAAMGYTVRAVPLR